jgi:hypothetical protein
MQTAYTAAGGLEGLPNLLLLSEQFATRYVEGEGSNLTINVPDQVLEEEDGEGFITRPNFADLHMSWGSGEGDILHASIKEASDRDIPKF